MALRGQGLGINVVYGSARSPLCTFFHSVAFSEIPLNFMSPFFLGYHIRKLAIQ